MLNFLCFFFQGHADFYVNGGTSQPGCASTTLFKTLACDHTKVTPYFIESINSERGFFAGPCRNLLSYVLGWCHPKDEEYVLMGEHCTPKYVNRLIKNESFNKCQFEIMFGIFVILFL